MSKYSYCVQTHKPPQPLHSTIKTLNIFECVLILALIFREGAFRVSSGQFSKLQNIIKMDSVLSVLFLIFMPHPHSIKLSITQARFSFCAKINT